MVSESYFDGGGGYDTNIVVAVSCSGYWPNARLLGVFGDHVRK